jgi:hypothetical protein
LAFELQLGAARTAAAASPPPIGRLGDGDIFATAMRCLYSEKWLEISAEQYSDSEGVLSDSTLANSKIVEALVPSACDLAGSLGISTLTTPPIFWDRISSSAVAVGTAGVWHSLLIQVETASSIEREFIVRRVVDFAVGTAAKFPELQLVFRIAPNRVMEANVWCRSAIVRV